MMVIDWSAKRSLNEMRVFKLNESLYMKLKALELNV